MLVAVLFLVRKSFSCSSLAAAVGLGLAIMLGRNGVGYPKSRSMQRHIIAPRNPLLRDGEFLIDVIT